MPPIECEGKKYIIAKNKSDQCKGCAFACFTMNGTGCKCPDCFPTTECNDGEVYIEIK